MRAGICAIALVTSFVMSGPQAAGQGDGRGWLALGDSYSSGEGIPGTLAREAEGSGFATQGRDCRRATGEGTDATAWSVGAFRSVQGELGLSEIALVACSGAVTAEFDEQIGEARARYGRERWNIVTFSVGGNDIGFDDVLKGCLDLNSVWGAFDLSPGCDISEADLRASIDELRRTLGGVYDSVADVVEPGGDVIVVGYPQLIEEVAHWDRWRRNVIGNCEGIQSYDVSMLRKVAGYLNQQMALAAQDADARHRDQGVRFHFLDISADPYEYSDRATDRHALCTDSPWLNGQTVGITSGDWRLERSFHPHQEGHTNTARVLASFVQEHVDLDDTAGLTISDADLLRLAGCREGPCAVTGRIPVDHPRWGRVLLVTFGPQPGITPMCADRMLIAVGGSGDIVWESGVSDGGCPWYRFGPAGAAEYGSEVRSPVDEAGRIFLDWDPGRYNGVTVLSVTDEGFADHRTLPVETYGVRFYSAVTEDTDADGIYEIRTSLNDCFESCAGGTTSETVFAWDGRDFVPVAPQAAQRCGGLWLGSSNGEEDLVEDITVVGVSCYEAYGLDGRQIVSEIATAHEPFSDVRDFSAAGYRCSVSDGGLEEQRYRCEGTGVITFRRYGRT